MILDFWKETDESGDIDFLNNRWLQINYCV